MAFRFDKLIVKEQQTAQRSQELAEDQGHSQISAMHLLTALLKEQDGIIQPLVQKIGANVLQLRTAAFAEQDRLPKVSGTAAQVSLATDLNQVLEPPEQQAGRMKDACVSPEHPLIGLVSVDSPARKLRNLNGIGEHDVVELRGPIPGAAALRQGLRRAGGTGPHRLRQPSSCSTANGPWSAST